MYKWYKLENYKPYWNNESTAIPYKHIEEIVKELEDTRGNNTILWKEINNAINWAFPLEEATLQTKQQDYPQYLKCTDGTNNFYFYFSKVNNVASQKNNTFYYDVNYQLDNYMTYFHNKLHILLDKNIRVKHIKKFSNRLEWTVDENNKVKSITFDLLKNKEFGNTEPINNNQLVRNYCYGTNYNQLWKDNYNDIEIPNNVEIPNWKTADRISIDWADFYTANERGRYGYIICKSSAKQYGKTDQSKSFQGHASNTKLIIPLFNVNNEYQNNLINGLLNFDITIEQECLVNALSADNFIGYFECDIPFSIWYGESKKNNKVKLLHGYNKINTSDRKNIIFFEVPANYAPKIKIVNFTNYSKGIEGKIKTIIKNINYWIPESEPTLLNPSYYQERTYIDNGKYLSTDTSLIKFNISDINTLENTGLNLYAYLCMDNILSIAYDYDQFNNELNPIWNNKNSNLRSELSINSGIYGSSSDNFYANNANTMTTGLQVLRNNIATDWVNQGSNLLKEIFHPIKNFIKLVTHTTQQSYKTINDNLEMSKNINNIASNPNTTLSNPFVDASIPNKEIEGNTLFNTYTNELHPWDKEVIFENVLMNGYPFNKIDNINTFNNRKYMNVLQIDVSYNFDTLIHTLINNDNTIFNSLDYNYTFLAWLSCLHRVYNTLDLINVLDYKDSGYIDNLEKDLPIFPDIRTNINNYIKNTNIQYSTYRRIWKRLLELNPNIPDDLYKDIEIVQYDNSITITAWPNSKKYYGSILINCIKLPNELLINTNITNNGIIKMVYYKNDNDSNTDLTAIGTPNIIKANLITDIPNDVLTYNYNVCNIDFIQCSDDLIIGSDEDYSIKEEWQETNIFFTRNDWAYVRNELYTPITWRTITCYFDKITNDNINNDINWEFDNHSFIELWPNMQNSLSFKFNSINEIWLTASGWTKTLDKARVVMGIRGSISGCYWTNKNLINNTEFKRIKIILKERFNE